MQGSVRLGFWIAAVIAAVVLAFSFFGTRHESWFVRAAQQNAVRCLTQSPCPQLTAKGVLVAEARPPLDAASVCARRENWQQLKSASDGQTRIVLTCTDGAAYLYHMGSLAGRKGGAEQWMRCARPSCEAEGNVILRRTSAP